MPSNVEIASWTFPDDPTSPSVEEPCGGRCGACDEKHRDWERWIDRSIADAERLATMNRELKEELIRRNQEITDLQITNRNLSRKIVEDARKRGEAATQQPNFPRGIHGS